MKQLLWIAMVGMTILLLPGCKKDVKPSVAVVTTTLPGTITSSSAQTGGAITSTGNSPITLVGVCWALHTGPTLADSIISSNSSSAGPFTVSMTNLNANTVYYVRAFVTNGVGTAYGAVDSFTTSSGVPTVTTASITNNQALAAQSGGTIVNNGGAAITASGICWSTSQIPTVSGTKTVGSIATGSFSDTLTNLTLGNTYYVRAYATNSFGTAYGNQVNFTVSAAGTVKDFDGNVYPTVTIGTQTWTTTNLRVTHYQNGDTLQNAFTTAGFDWTNSTTGAYTFANGDSTTKTAYGLLYSLYAARDSRNIAPAGWHVATESDWTTMAMYVGLPAADTGVVGLTGAIGPLLQSGGSSGLNLQLAGYWLLTKFANFGLRGYYWTGTASSATWNYYWGIFGPTTAQYQSIIRNYTYGGGFAVRCVKD